MTTKKRGDGRDAILNAPSATPSNDAAMDSKFEMRPDGLMRRSEDKRPWRICGHFEVYSETRTEDDTQIWGVLIRFRDRDGVVQREILTRDLFAGEGAELRSLLARRGLFVNPARGAGAALCEYLASIATPRRARVVARTGWHRIDGARVFVLPDEVFGKSPVEVIYAPVAREPSLFNTGGTLEEWREAVAARCVGNTRLMLAVSAAFAAPLLELLAEDGGGLHLRGASRVGKTTALRVAASVWGGEPGSGAGAYIRQWRATSNAVEGVAAAHSDTLLALDELGQADARDIGASAYMLANGQGKSRADRGGGLRAPLRFRTLFLSTGELGLADKIAEAGGSVKAGQEVRLVDLAADAGAGMGLLGELHGAASAAVFTQALRDATACCYGTAAPVFLRYLVGRLHAEPELSSDLRRWQDDLVREWLDEHSDAGGQVRSVARRFALMAIAGELATKADVTGWVESDATRAAETCFHDWLGLRGTAGAREDAQAVAQIRDFVGAHGSSRFEDWRDPPADVEAPHGDTRSTPPIERFRTVHRAGWKRWKLDGADGPVWTYYILPAAMHEALKGLDFKAALRVLSDRGLLLAGSGGKSSQTANPPGHPKARVYVLCVALLGAEDAAD
jgi:putative DNA primase/helicase